MKKILVSLIVLLSLSFASQALAENEITLSIDNKTIESDVAPQIIDGRTMVPVRAIFESVGAEVEWNAETKTITGTNGIVTVIMTLESNIALVNGEEVIMDSSPVIIDGRTLAPARYVAESFGCTVEWDSDNKAVIITSPLSNTEMTTLEASTETTTEATTEATTAVTTETTTNPMYSYDTYYAPGTYSIGKDMPVGEYIVFANPDKIGYLYSYSRDGNVSTTTGKRALYSKYFDYCDVIKVTSGNYLDLSNSYAIPSADVDLLDTSHNGTFRAGTDIKTGHLTFKLSSSSSIGYVNIGYPDAANADKTIVYLTPEDDSVTVNITKGMYIQIFACDILNENLKTISEYSHITEVNSTTDSSYSFDSITPSVKKTVDDYLTTLLNDLEPSKFTSTKFTANYYNKIADSWNSAAVTGADRKYIALAKEMYSHIRVYATNTKGENATAASISINGTTMSGTAFRNILKYEKEYISNTVNSFKSGTSFADLEVAVKQLSYLRYDVPFLTGTAISQ